MGTKSSTYLTSPRPGWAQWHAQDFKDRGLYFTYVYTYLRKQRVTVQELIYVNTQTQQIRVERFLKPSLQISLRTSSPEVTKSVANITRVVQDSIAHFDGPSIQSVLESDKYEALRNSFCVAQTADCNLDSEALRKKYPPSTPSDSDLSPVQLISSVPAEYTSEARAAKLNGTVSVSLVVDAQGLPKDLRVVHPLGKGLDQAALNAVRQYRFKPALDATGVPVQTVLDVDVNFRIY